MVNKFAEIVSESEAISPATVHGKINLSHRGNCAYDVGGSQALAIGLDDRSPSLDPAVSTVISAA